MAEAPGFEEQEELLVEEEGAGLAPQWSLEDEAEAARERRRQERDRHVPDQDQDQDQDGDSQSPEPPEQEKLLKASGAPELDEDEGFGDWSQKAELRQPPRAESPEGEQEEDRFSPAQVQSSRLASPSPRTAQSAPVRVHPSMPAPVGQPTTPGHPQTHLTPTQQPLSEAHSPHREQGRLGPGTSQPRLQGGKDMRQGHPERLETGSSLSTSCGNWDGGELSPAGVCLEGLRLCPSSEPWEGTGPEQTQPAGPEETSQGSPGPAEAEEAEEQHQKCQQPRTPSPLVVEETTELSSPPLSPSTKLIDRTESLTRSIKKSNSVKRSQPALPISKIDDRLEQYTQAIETAGRTPKLTRQPSIELPSMAVASTKSRWETGEVQAQSAAKGPSCKDIVAGDMSKKSLWEQKGGSKTSSTIKSTPSGKRYKFVATGHGKYEKVLMDED